MADEPIIIEGPEPSRVDPALADAGLPPVVGVQSVQVFRASRDVPELTDGRGWTYHHHVDMACWRGRLYVGWNSCERDEDVWPSRELYSTSADGATWTKPAELFPQGVSTPLRMYFFVAPNGRMLAIAGLRVDTARTSEDAKGGLVVREVGVDHSLGPVFMLQSPPALPAGDWPPLFDQSSTDHGFIEAGRQLLSNRPFLEQQDRGRLLGDRRMKWHDVAAWPGGKVPGDSDKWVSGKAFSFFRRPDGVLVGVSKMGWTTTSGDAGETWTQPTVPPTLVTGKAKVWGQRTPDGRYALVYNPSRRNRYPLVIVTGDDGIRFGGMRVVQGELPIQRYAGRDRSIGPQYVRGISAWADDGSRAGEPALWLTYSMSKEDVWVSRVELPVTTDVAGDVADDFAAIGAESGPLVPRWNTYCPKWTAVRVADGGLEVEDRDPYDYARATRVFGERRRVDVSFEVMAGQAEGGTLEIDLLPAWGAARPVQITLTPEGQITARGGSGASDLGGYTPGRWLSLKIEADAERGQYVVTFNGRRGETAVPFAEPADSLHRLSFRTGAYRNVGGANPVAPGTDRPTEPAVFRIRNVRVTGASR